jgi:hypothetical protein
MAEKRLEVSGCAGACAVRGAAERLAPMSARTTGNENVRPERFTTAPLVVEVRLLERTSALEEKTQGVEWDCGLLPLRFVVTMNLSNLY